MNWYYAAGGQQQGPVDDAQLDALVNSGQVNAETLVWHEGMPNWQPLRQARPGTTSADLPPQMGAVPPATGAASTGEVICAECGKTFTRDNAIQYGTAWVCAACKPVFLQKLREGARVGGAFQTGTGTYVDPDALLAQVMARDYSVDIGGCISRAWQLTKTHFWLLVGASFVVHACQGAAGAIPILGYCTGPILQGPLIGGLYLLYLKLARNEQAEFGEAFSGFSNFLPLMLASVVMTIVMYAWFIPALVCFGFAAKSNNESLMIIAAGLGVLGLPGAAYFWIAWIFAFLLIMDKKCSFWTAMSISRKVVNKCWWGMLGLFIVVILLQIVGFLALCLGILVSITLIYGSIVYAYEDIFHTNAQN